MADAFLSPAVGGGMWALSAAAVGVSIRKNRKISGESNRIVSLTAVSAAFIFAAQMINFTIPGTGSSGHIAGALFLSILLGPYLSFLAMAAILLIQALFFADGGILAYGANLFNMAFFTNFIAYPLIYKTMTRKNKSGKNLYAACILSSVAGLQMGAFAVVLQTLVSGRVDMPFSAFTVLMQSIHLAIGIIEGMITAVLVSYLFRHAPDIIDSSPGRDAGGGVKAAGLIGGAAFFCGAVLSLFASSHPDGLEWSIEHADLAPAAETATDRFHQGAEALQQKFSFLPDYGFSFNAEGFLGTAGTAVAGIAGVVLTAAVLYFLTAGLLSRRSAAGRKDAE